MTRNVSIEMMQTTGQWNRRSFLKGAGALPLAAAAAAAGAGFVTEPAAAELAPIPRAGKGPFLKTSVNAYSFTKQLNAKMKHHEAGMDLYDVVDFCAQHNVDGFDATGYFFPDYPTAPTDKYVNELKLRAFESGVAISGSGVRNNFTVADKDKRAADVVIIKRWVEIASQLGAPVLRVFADTQMRSKTWHDVAPGKTRAEVGAYIADNLKECAEHGEKHGVVIGVQNHGDFLQTAEQQLELIGMVDSKWCGAIVDTGYYKTPDPYVDMAKAAPYAVNWQIKQSAFGAASPIPLDLNRLMHIIKASGYRGFIPIETLSVSGREYDPFKVVPAFIDEVRRAMVQAA
jgi:sugar phosphate isomerase/epimerase